MRKDKARQSSLDKKPFCFNLNQDLIIKLKHLAVDQERFTGDMLEEAVRDLLKKYEPE